MNTNNFQEQKDECKYDSNLEEKNNKSIEPRVFACTKRLISWFTYDYPQGGKFV